jgi:hypothetical protein
MPEEYSGDSRYRKVKKPTVFMFQPDEFEEIEPHETAKLQEWEMAQAVAAASQQRKQ